MMTLTVQDIINGNTATNVKSVSQSVLIKLQWAASDPNTPLQFVKWAVTDTHTPGQQVYLKG